MGDMNAGDRAVLLSELEGLRSGFHSGLNDIRDQVAKLRDELIADRSQASTLWAVHDQTHRHTDAERLEERIQALEDWRIEMLTLGRLVKLTLGTSILGAVVSMVALLEMLNLH